MRIEQSGKIHIKLPFTSLDDISFEGTYAPLADGIVAALKDHLAKIEQDKAEYEPIRPEIESSEPKDAVQQEVPESNLQAVVDKYTANPLQKLLPDPNKLVIRER